MAKEDKIWHLSRIGGEGSLVPLVKEVLAPPASDEPMGQRTRFAAANALACIGGEAAIASLRELLVNTNWEVRLLAALVLLWRQITADGDNLSLKQIARECWSASGGEMLGFLSTIKGGIIYSPAGSEIVDYEPQSAISDLIGGLPTGEVREAAREMLTPGWHADFACQVLNLVGNQEDLPFLRTKLQSPGLREPVLRVIEHIQERL